MGRGKSLIFYPCKLGGISGTISSTQRASSVVREAGVCHPLSQTKIASFSNSQTFYMISHLPIFLSIQQNFFLISSFIYLFFAASRGMRDISSPTRDAPTPPAVGGWSLNRWTAREMPFFFF